jgi:hypothetical protein
MSEVTGRRLTVRREMDPTSRPPTIRVECSRTPVGEQSPQRVKMHRNALENGHTSGHARALMAIQQKASDRYS